MAHDWSKRERIAGADFHILALASAAGALLMVQANDLIVIFLGLEILSIGLYVLVGLRSPPLDLGRRRRSSTSCSADSPRRSSSTASALVYGATGSTNLSAISYFLSANVLLHPGLLYAGGRCC